ncbi:MAG TPA: hypothetical protein DIT46_05740, partial [Gemmatimonadetes bacterium]|nr:hypothetical protein [Gemmatimonadota bacterium]
RASYATADGSTITTENESSTVDAGVGWTRVPQSREIGLVPRQLRGLVRTLLPGFLEDKVADARLRLTPERVSMSTSYFHQDSRVVRYETIVRSAGDQQSVATLRPRELMQVTADVRLRPLPSLVADMRLLQSRDLLQPEETVADENVQQIIREERSEWLGLDLGWETARTLRTDVGYRPSIFSWLRTDFDWTTVYQSDRNTNFIEQSIQLTDTMMTLTQNAQGQRD